MLHIGKLNEFIDHCCCFGFVSAEFSYLYLRPGHAINVESAPHTLTDTVTDTDTDTDTHTHWIGHESNGNLDAMQCVTKVQCFGTALEISCCCCC